MRSALAIDPYQHRSVCENIAFFSEAGFRGISLYHATFLTEIAEGRGAELASALAERDLSFSVHAKLPETHAESDVLLFRQTMDAIAAWQKQYGRITVLSFDVADAIRDNVRGYLEYALETVPSCPVAFEDFGLNEGERAQIEDLKGGRFGYLLDVGHMLIRLIGQPTRELTLFQNSRGECPPSEMPGFDEFRRAFLSKEFPIYELHLHNNDGHTDQHRFLHEGVLDTAALALLLRRLDYGGIVTLESAPGYLFSASPEEADAGALSSLALWNRLLNQS